MTRTMTIVTVFLALLGIGVSIEHVFDTDHYNPGFAEWPNLMRVHVGLGALYLGIALLQFAPRIRASRPELHRRLGRVGVVAGCVAGITAFGIALLFPYGGVRELLVTAPFAFFFTFSLARGIWLARARRFAEHREWMIRAMAVGTSIATMRLIFVPSLMAIGATEENARWLSVSSFLLGFVVHVAVAEYWIRATRPAAQRDAAADPSLRPSAV